jgi:hypothetical protein
MDAASGGSGGEPAPAYRQDVKGTRLVEKALHQRWNIPEHLRDSLPAAMGVILLSKDSSPRNKIAAAKVLIAADNSNVKAEEAAKLDALQAEVDELRERVEGGGNGDAGDTSGGGQAAAENHPPEPPDGLVGPLQE